MKRACAAAAVVTVLGMPSAAQQLPTFSSTFEAVRVDVLVTDGGRVVRGLGPADFEVRDNGVLQQVDFASFEQLPLDVTLALDTSASVRGDGLEHLRRGGFAILDALRPEDHAALLTFSHAVARQQGLTRDVQRLRDALDGIDASGETALVDGVFAALTLGQAGAGRRLLIVFSDGLDTHSWLTPERVLSSAGAADVTVYAVILRGSGDAEFLEDLSELTGGSVVTVESTTDVGRTFVRILDEFRQRYVVSYSPRGVASSGWHRLDVRLKNRRATVRARNGYQAGE